MYVFDHIHYTSCVFIAISAGAFLLVKDYLDAALKTALQIHKYTHDGDILVFLPGQDEIEDVASLLKKHLEELEHDDSQEKSRDIVQDVKGIGVSFNSGNSMIVNGVFICVLYAALPPDAQMNAFRPRPDGCVRKIILSTNIAGKSRCVNMTLNHTVYSHVRLNLTQTETSVTLDGIKYVVDCGKHKTREYSSSTGMESLKLSNISKAQVSRSNSLLLALNDIACSP